MQVETFYTGSPSLKYSFSSFRLHFAASALLLMLLIWLASGTMAPYAATLASRLVRSCGYLVNVDHPHHKAAFLLLDGADRKLWEFSVVLRRILFPLFAYPLMKLWGYEKGGFFASVLLHLLAFSFFVSFVRKQAGERAAVFSMWLLATYPGIAYWAALPYANAAIVPCSLLAVIFLWKLTEATEAWHALGWATLLGILFTAYDLLPFFGLAALLIVALNRRYRHLPLVVAGLITPQLIVSGVLKFVYAVSPVNSNTEIYYYIVNSYLHRPDFAQWAPLLKAVPRVFVENYLFSNFFFLPMLFLFLWALNFFGPRLPLHRVEKTVLLAVALVFLFNNLAPPYPGWQMRGSGITRLYQPVFVVLVLFSVRMLQATARSQTALQIACLILYCGAVIGNAAISFGPVLNSPYTGEFYYRFYRHSPPQTLLDNLRRYGRRPLGFCADVVAPDYYDDVRNRSTGDLGGQ